MILLASASEIRLTLLRAAGVAAIAVPARIDEESMRIAMQAEGARSRDIADSLAEAKAQKIASKNPTSLVLGCDQILELKGKIFSKPERFDDARVQLSTLNGQTHRLLSAAVLYQGGQPIWRHVEEARLTMRVVSDPYLTDYLTRNWDSIRHSVGCYKLEEEGIRLFSAIEGDHFTILGLPLLPLLSYLGTRGLIPA